jgi:hypothetical protein
MTPRRVHACEIDSKLHCAEITLFFFPMLHVQALVSGLGSVELVDFLNRNHVGSEEDSHARPA